MASLKDFGTLATFSSTTCRTTCMQAHPHGGMPGQAQALLSSS